METRGLQRWEGAWGSEAWQAPGFLDTSPIAQLSTSLMAASQLETRPCRSRRYLCAWIPDRQPCHYIRRRVIHTTEQPLEALSPSIDLLVCAHLIFRDATIRYDHL